MVEQNGAIMTLGTDVEISADAPVLLTVHGKGKVLNQTSEPLPVNGNTHYKYHDISIMRSRESLEGQLKILQVCAYHACISCIPNNVMMLSSWLG